MPTAASVARPAWSWIAPLIGWIMLAVAFGVGFQEGLFALAILAALVASVLASVHHAEVIAHRIGEPYGTLVLAVAVTIVELSLIVTLMLAGGEEAYSLARDSVFAAFMIATTGIVGLSLFAAGVRYGEVKFEARGAASALSVLAALAVLTLVMPNYTLHAAGPVFSPIQLAFVATVSLTLYLTFVFVQTVRHRNYFLSLPDEVDEDAAIAARPSRRDAGLALALLLFGLVAVVLLAKALAPTLDDVVAAAGAPRQVAGVAIAALVLLPEGLSAVRAARRNQLQTSLNLALGSALATIGLTIPGVAVFAHFLDEPLVLGISPEQTVLLTLTLLVSTTTLANGRSTILQGAVHLTIFVTYLLLSFVP
jgi:Ca2+:H+ antiporter